MTKVQLEQLTTKVQVMMTTKIKKYKMILDTHVLDRKKKREIN